jgi:hypothetical protein
MTSHCGSEIALLGSPRIVRTADSNQRTAGSESRISVVDETVAVFILKRNLDRSVAGHAP